jgi:hypothetical protein
MDPTCAPRYARHRFPAEVISYAVWLYFRFPLSLRMVEEMLAARGIEVSHETVWEWALKVGQSLANQLRRSCWQSDKWHLDEVVHQHREPEALTMAGAGPAWDCAGPPGRKRSDTLSSSSPSILQSTTTFNPAAIV